ncbi:hypothetical protein ES703_87759 [subsurface metagenome]
MVRQVNIHEAKTNLSRLINQVIAGDEIIIAYCKPKSKRVPGSAIGQIQIAEDFDAPLPDNLLNEFEK